MSRRTDLLNQLLGSKKFGVEKEQEQQFLMATAELILSDLVDIALKGVEQHGAGSLVINLINDSTTFMSGHAIEFDLHTAEREEDEEILEFLRKLIEEIDENDWSQNVLITFTELTADDIAETVGRFTNAVPIMVGPVTSPVPANPVTLTSTFVTGVTSLVDPVAVKLPTGTAIPPPTPTATVPTAPVPTSPPAARLLSVTRDTTPTVPVAPTPVARTRVTDASSPIGT